MIKAGLAALWLAAFAVPAVAQIPGLPGIPRPGQQQQPRAPRDSVRDTLTYRFPAPDSITARLLQMPGYTATRYVADTVRFDAEQRALDLLASKKQPAVVERDSQIVVSDSAIYYTESNRRVVTLGNYVLTPPPSSGQAPVKGVGRIDYDLAERSARITHARLPVSNGDMWYLTVDVARIEVDTVGKGNTEWVGGGSMTSCNDSIPDYHFEYKEAKRTGGNTLIARPAILYIKDIPVMWLPFIFSDTRSGRHSGLLPPQFGVGDIVRSSPSYHRSIEHLGYYWAMSDYMDFSTWLDWRSGAGGQEQGDPGWLRLNGDWNYKWLNRFLSGRIGLAYTNQNDGMTNTAISWSHQQDLGRNQHINTSVNYVTSTTLQRQNTFNPYTALQTIASQANYQAKMGPASLTIGATRKQYPGRPQVDQTFPTVTLSTTPVAIGSHFNWTPGFSFSRSDVMAMDQPGLGQYTYRLDATGRRDSVLSKDRNSASAQMTIDSPIQIFGWSLRNSVRITQQRNNFPQQFQIYDVNTGAVTDTRIFAATYNTNVDWNPDFALPPLGHNKFNLTPSISLQNVDPGPFWVASERTNGRFVHQSKRLSYALNASPTVFGFFPGFGPFSRIRHAITPSISYSYAPEAHVSDEYLIALGKTRKGYLGAYRQNQITFGLNQNFEAKPRSRNDSAATDNGQPIRLLSVNFSPISYDFERAHQVGRALNGFTTENFTYSVTSDLLKGFDFSSSYSLFQGSTLSDTAVFKPVLTGISASFNISRDQNPFAMFTRLFGRAVPEPTKAPNPPADQVRPTSETNSPQAQAIAAQPVAGSERGGDRFIVPPTQGWRASFTFTRSSPRQPTGSGVIDYDPAARCAALVGSTDSFLYNACIENQRAQPTTDTPVTSNTSGGQLYRIPPTTSVNSDISFNLTPRWAAHWTTTYDVERHQFASHIVQLQRELHDWRAIFGFTQSPNGNFAFNFTISLKAEPDIKFDYNKTTLGAGTAVP
jgi:hypothetical protein